MRGLCYLLSIITFMLIPVSVFCVHMMLLALRDHITTQFITAITTNQEYAEMAARIAHKLCVKMDMEQFNCTITAADFLSLGDVYAQTEL